VKSTAAATHGHERADGGAHALAPASNRWRAFAGLLREAWREYERDHARYFAVAMVYYALVSLIPLLLLVLAALGLLLRYSDFAAVAEAQVLETVTASFGAELSASLEELLNRLQQESVVASLVSLVGLLLAASVLFNHLRLSFRAIWKYEPPLMSGPVRVIVLTTFLEKSVAFVMVLAGGVLLLAAIALVAGIHWLGGLFVGVPLLGETAGQLLALPIPVVIAAVTFALLFKFLPPARLPWRHVWLAALLCAAAWFIAVEALALYGVLFGSSPSTSGAIGALLVIMLWMQVVSQVLFFGAELCKVVAQRETRPGGAGPAHTSDPQ
jgi:membrane protein